LLLCPAPPSRHSTFDRQGIGWLRSSGWRRWSANCLFGPIAGRSTSGSISDLIQA
jgi:hypothetical protein